MARSVGVGHDMNGERYFSPDSLFWHINREAMMVLSGPRALLLELAHPLVAAVGGPHGDRGEERGGVRDHVDPAAGPRRGRLRDEQAEDGPCEREEHRQGEQGRVHGG